jgi:hypothetical protein
MANVSVPAPVQKTFVAEGEILEHASNKSFWIWNEALKKPMAPRYAAFGTRPLRQNAKVIIRTLFV